MIKGYVSTSQCRTRSKLSAFPKNHIYDRRLETNKIFLLRMQVFIKRSSEDGPPPAKLEPDDYKATSKVFQKSPQLYCFYFHVLV